MLKNYFKIAWRNLRNNKVYSFINIAGLAIGMAACIVIMLFVEHERSFDRMHTANIYRLNEVQTLPGMAASMKVALTMYPMGPTLKREFPEIVNYTHVRWNMKYQVTYGDKRLFLPQMFAVDTSFLTLFNFPLVDGDKATALQRPNSILITESTAQKLFGREDPVGKTIAHYDADTMVFVVTGVLADVPDNSQMQFDAVCSQSTFYKPFWIDNWGGNWLNTYVELAPNTNVAALEQKFPDYLKNHLTQNEMWRYFNLFLTPLRDVHAHTGDIALDYINYGKFDASYTNIFFIIALIVLVIAAINFMNLSTARSAERAKEVGIRKSIGALRTQLTWQFLSEAVLLALLALAIAVGLVLLVLPAVNNLSQRHLDLFRDPWMLVAILGGTVALGLVSGLYPAAYLSSFQPVKVLKGLPRLGKNKGMLRNVLVVIQFTSAVFLIISTAFVFRQLNYVRTKDTGFDRDEIVTLALDRISSKKYDVLKQRLLQNPAIAGITGAQDQLGSPLDQSGVRFWGDGPVRTLATTRLIVDPDYLKVYKIPLVAGRDFSDESQANGHEYILNEALAQELNKEKPNQPLSDVIGKHFGFDSLGTIVGIARNFNFNSLHYKIETMFLFNNNDNGYFDMSVKLRGGKATEAMAFINAEWKHLFPDRPIEYQFLDEHFAQVYRADSQVSRIVGILAALAIFISCLGLFGLAAYAAERRIKEIAVRKVMGASTGSIAALLSKQFLRLVVAANLLAWPMAYLAMHRWLSDYAYRVPLSWWVFLLAGMLSLGIALVTVSTLAIRASMANPVKSLRTE